MNAAILLAIALAGAVGAVSRFVLGDLVRSFAGDFPLHVLVVNVLGCLGFGLCYGLGSDRWSDVMRAAVFVGFFGSFTTFSTFAFDCRTLFDEGRLLALGLNLLGHNALGLLAIVAGVRLASMFR